MTVGAPDRSGVRLLGSLACAVVAVFAAGCSPGSTAGDAEKLEALRNDPLARYEPPGGRLVNNDEVQEHTSFGKSVEARITRVFSLPDGDLEKDLARTLAAAEAAGWTVSDGPVVRMDNAFGQTASRRLSSGFARMSVTVYPNGTPGGTVHGPALVVSLRHS